MGKVGVPPSKRVRLVSHVLVVVILLLGLSLLAGTLYALIFRPHKYQYENDNALSLGNDYSANIKGQTFTGIGQIRVSTAPPHPAAVVFSITFPYSPEDKGFTEELASRIKDFRRIASEYLCSFSLENLRVLDEDEIKMELLRQYNALLRLGHIEVLYISDFMIIE